MRPTAAGRATAGPADTPTGPFIAPGDPVTWTYTITNPGNVALTSVTVVDDQGVTVAAASTNEADLRSGSTGSVEAAAKVGQLVAERAKAAGVDKVVFDRGGFAYHGRIAAVASAAREAGLEF